MRLIVLLEDGEVPQLELLVPKPLYLRRTSPGTELLNLFCTAALTQEEMRAPLDWCWSLLRCRHSVLLLNTFSRGRTDASSTNHALPATTHHSWSSCIALQAEA
jgi:hypothetical protein